MKRINYGGKANSLITLKENHFPVPSFFILDHIDYQFFLDANNLKKEIKDLANKNQYLEIQTKIMDAEMPIELKNKIKKNWQQLNSKYVSVRSSAIGEDGLEKSFAGQYKTYLHVLFDDLYMSIKKCWCSLYDENVILYSDIKNLYGMNVIIQTMIIPDYAGVAFSKDITSTTGNYSVVEIVSGSGEKLVSGHVTPTKYLIRRQTLHIDLTIGNIKIEEKIIQKLETIILEIEQLYKKPVDVEYAIQKNEIYILQARPITANSIPFVSYSLSITRPQSIIEQEIYFQGEYKGIKKLTRNLYYFKPLFLYNCEDNNVLIYYNESDLEEDPRLMYYYLDLDYSKIKQEYEIIKQYVQYLNNVIDYQKDIELDTFINYIIAIYPFSSLGQLAGHFDEISDRIREILYDFRENYDYIIHKSTDYLLKEMKKTIPKELQSLSSFITMKEYKSKIFPNKEIVKKRKNGYIYFGKLYVTKDYQAWLEKHNKSIKEITDSLLYGQTAYAGVVRGRVCKVCNEQDLKKFKKGDILVTPMTVPNFIKIMKQASAIVTDEGGITCHAAIISRELKIPCVVGCKNITKVLHDGDEIEVDANVGQIHILIDKMQ